MRAGHSLPVRLPMKRNMETKRHCRDPVVTSVESESNDSPPQRRRLSGPDLLLLATSSPEIRALCKTPLKNYARSWRSVPRVSMSPPERSPLADVTDNLIRSMGNVRLTPTTAKHDDDDDKENVPPRTLHRRISGDMLPAPHEIVTPPVRRHRRSKAQIILEE